MVEEMEVTITARSNEKILSDFFGNSVLDVNDGAAFTQLTRMTRNGFVKKFTDLDDETRVKAFRVSLGEVIISRFCSESGHKMLNRSKLKLICEDIYEFVMAITDGKLSQSTQKCLQKVNMNNQTINNCCSVFDQSVLDAFVERFESMERKLDLIVDANKILVESNKLLLNENVKLNEDLKNVETCAKCTGNSPLLKRKMIRPVELEVSGGTPSIARSKFNNVRIGTPSEVFGALGRSKVLYSKAGGNNYDAFKEAGGSRRKYKPVSVVKGVGTANTFGGMTVEKRVHFCVSGFGPDVEAADVKEKLSKIVKSVHEVTLVKNKYGNYTSFKMFKVTVGANDIETMNNPDKIDVNLSVRRFNLPRSDFIKTNGSATAAGSNTVESVKGPLKI